MSVRSPKGSGSIGGSGVPGGPVSQAGSRPAKSGSKSKSASSSLLELAAIIAIAVLLALGIQAFILKPYKIPSGSMEPTLKIGQRVLVNRIGMRFDGPYIGEIVVFHPPKRRTRKNRTKRRNAASPRARATFGGAACDQTYPEKASVNFIKRIVAGPGDTSRPRRARVPSTENASRTPTSIPVGGSPSATS